MNEQNINTPRKPRCVCFVGTNGTGKSTACERLMLADERGLMILPTFDDWAQKYDTCDCEHLSDFDFTGVRCHIVDHDPEGTIENIFRYFRGGTLVFDDPKVYIKKNLDNHPIKKILARRRQMRCDVVFVAHSFMDIPPMFFSYITDYLIFNCGNAERRKNELGEHYDAIARIIDRVHRAAKTNPHAYEHYATGL